MKDVFLSVGSFKIPNHWQCLLKFHDNEDIEKIVNITNGKEVIYLEFIANDESQYNFLNVIIESYKHDLSSCPEVIDINVVNQGFILERKQEHSILRDFHLFRPGKLISHVWSVDIKSEDVVEIANDIINDITFNENSISIFPGELVSPYPDFEKPWNKVGLNLITS